MITHYIPFCSSILSNSAFVIVSIDFCITTVCIELHLYMTILYTIYTYSINKHYDNFICKPVKIINMKLQKSEDYVPIQFLSANQEKESHII